MYSSKSWKKFKRSGAYRYQIQRNRIIFNKTIHADISTQIYRPTRRISGLSTSVPESATHNLVEHHDQYDSVTIDDLSEDNEVPVAEIEETFENLSDDHVYEIETNQINLREKLRNWAIEYNIRHQALQKLLGFLRKAKLPDEGLPQDPRTLLETPNRVILYPLGTGQYWHQGLERCLRQYFNDTLDRSMSISLNFNIDGLPIYKSSQWQFWPILFNIFEIKNFKPMVIGIYCGKGKPSNLTDYLRQFVDECKHLIENGVFVNGHKLNIRIRCFICDSPARAFIKDVTYFNGKHGCLKCTVVGEYVNYCTVFLHTHCERRTNLGFREKIYGSHHKNISILEELPIDMIEDFPIVDSLHLIDLGIVKKCLNGWTNGDFKGTDIKFSATDIKLITEILIKIKMPREIHRAIRGLDSLSYWKGTEYRTFLYYVGIVVLKDVLRYDAYEHFLSFFCAITICSNKKYKHLLQLAKILLEHYIEKYIELHKKKSITSNVHNLCHLVDEVERFGNLDSFNAYPFENSLSTLKHMLRTGSNPLAQAANRIAELNKINK